VEQWKPVVGYEGRYEVSSQGRVRSLPRARTKGGVLKPWEQGKCAYLAVKLRDRPSRRDRSVLVHTLVAEAFLGPRPTGEQVRHLNTDSRDNRAENLAYGSAVDNARDAIEHGKTAAARTHCKHGHEFTQENTRYRKRGEYTVRDCLACEKKRNADRYLG
jgi:hypothetical protein